MTQPSPVLQALLDQVRATRAAYYRGVDGVTYEDMAAAAERYLRMRNVLQGKAGNLVTKGQIASLLRGL